MENKDTEKLAQTILADSKLELTNPDFTRNLMSQINAENRKRIILRKSLFYLFLFISIDTIILTMMKLLGFSMADLSGFIESVTLEIANTSSKSGDILLVYFLIQAIILFIMKRVMDSRLLSMKSGKE